VLTDDGRAIPIRLDQVAVIQFGSGQPTPAELNALSRDNTQLIVRRNGSVEPGQVIDITAGGDVVRWQGRNGREQVIPFRSLTRIYLNTDRARAAFNDGDRSDRGARDRGDRGSRDPRAGNGNDPGFGNRNDPGAGNRNGPGVGNGNNRSVGTSGLGDVRVEANQAWTNTGVNVRAGDLVVFKSSGRINFGQGSTQNAGPEGNDSLKEPGYPVHGLGVGGLIGRVGNSAPFAIGSNSQAIRMPANGNLVLGVNDDQLGDNSGSYAVVISRQ
jgi:hypothetical protein